MKFFICIDDVTREVTKEKWKSWERYCGFRAKRGSEFATQSFSFSQGGISIRGWRE